VLEVTTESSRSSALSDEQSGSQIALRTRRNLPSVRRLLIAYGQEVIMPH
jgi:hypothetical protein